jgi:hypothetical protein
MVKNKKGGFVFRVPERIRNIGIVVLCCVTLAALFVDVVMVHVRPVEAQGYSRYLYLQAMKDSGLGNNAINLQGQTVLGFSCVPEGSSSVCYILSH